MSNNKLSIVFTEDIFDNSSTENTNTDTSDILNIFLEGDDNISDDINFNIPLSSNELVEIFEENKLNQSSSNIQTVDPYYNKLSVSRQRTGSRKTSNHLLTRTFGNPANTSSRVGVNNTPVFPMTTVRSMPWLQTPMSLNKSKNRAKKVDLVVLYHIFEQYSEHVTDPYWVNVLKTCSYGEMPTGSYYRNNVISTRKGTQIISYEIDLNPETGAKRCVDFFRDNCGLKSDEDIKNLDKELEKCGISTQTLSQMSWKDIKKAKTRKSLVLDYVYNTKAERNLTDDQVKNLETQINIGINLKLFSNDHIIFENGKILGIKGLKWDHNREEFYIDRSMTNTYKQVKIRNSITQEMYSDPNYKVIPQGKYVNYSSLWEKLSKKYPKD